MFLVFITLAVTAIVLLLKYVYSYWERQEFPTLKASIPFGNLKEFIKRQKSFGTAIYDMYNSSKEPFIGIYLFFHPAVLIRDAKLAKRIVTEDFNSFFDRGVHSNEKVDPMSANLFSLRGKEWKDLRQKLSPGFTSGRLKQMFSTVEDVGTGMQNYLEETIPKEGKVVELKNISLRYVVDILGSVFFGLEVNSFKNPDNDFYKLRDKLMPKSFFEGLAAAAKFLCPTLYDWGLYKFAIGANDEIIGMVRQIIEHREKNNITRKDVMQTLIELRNNGFIKEHGDFNTKISETSNKTLSIEQCAAQAFLFYIAGLETTSSTIAWCLYELAQNEDVRNKLVEDINSTLARHNGEISYESINDMKYLHLCVNETMRKYPGLPQLNRECNKTYRIPGSKYAIEKGTSVIISVTGLHRDPEYFPDPLAFKPERFAEGSRDYNEDAYLPFGDGPRICIGIRQGLISAKVGIVKILTKFNIETIPKKELEISPYAIATEAKGGINVKLFKIEN